MKHIGVIRYQDKLGRIVIPMEIRKANNWTRDTPIEMLSTDEGLLIRGYKPDEENERLIEKLYDITSREPHTHSVLNEVIDYLKTR
ncbi:AbrB/MazE/SpoVT family DNA-binding domain-containing protein [Metabacillus idriensis]|uniref:AbrB/MazE/SpoVT family DNA-binding domain-containing protein n=1 Tax=Metabacillus idriensis TaxID=324768 RepID=UPI00203CA83D|nr:AbrB/MazE/SpoVT family DNA-binding domain-containing protein [Metabacillus idriensis]MCM3598668.1 AbrB/MazE/SpoVT family DNA-binding domain-containing protein [Metabacillus idriensis]